MTLIEIIQGQFAVSDLKAQTKWNSIEELLGVLTRNGVVSVESRDKVLQALVDREKNISTGLTDHVAIPHATTNLIGCTVGALGISRKGIPFESLDGKDAKIICLLLIPQSGFRQHIKTAT